MPAPTTVPEFLELVRKSGVVEEKRLAAYLDRLRSGPGLPADPNQLASLLVADGLLTHFQQEQLSQGKWRRFIIGKYKVLERLGAGGMGTVYLCEHQLMRRRVAVKVLPTARAEDSAALERFYREARAVAALDHPNIVRAYDIDQDEHLHFLVMEYVDGASLLEIVRKSGRMDVLRAAHYFRQAALGLQHAHEGGLVHRDIKPGNILVDRNGLVKVLDMGLARFFRDEADDITKKHDENCLGTADYLAPEQVLDSHAVDIRADIYALGATLYFCLAGRAPFAEGSVAQKLFWHQTRPPRPLRELRPDVPEGMAAIVERMMAKDPAERYQTPAAVAEALAPWTQTPIPPPPEHELPQLSPAARGVASDLSLVPGHSTVSRGPASRSRVDPLAPSTITSAPAPPTQRPAPVPAAPAPMIPALTLPEPPPPPPRAPVPRSATVPAALRPAVNGSLQEPQRHLTQPSAPTALPVAEEESSPWDQTANDSQNPSSDPGTGLGGGIVVRRRLDRAGLREAQRRRFWWVFGITSLVVLGGLGSFLAWVFLAASEPPLPARQEAPPRPTFVVDPRGKANASSTIKDAFQRARGGGVRILLRGDVTEAEVRVSGPDITIEADEATQPTWKCPGNAPAGTMLLRVNNAPGFRLKGLTLDGSDRARALVNLYGRCAGASFEDLKLKGFRDYGMWVNNCEGEVGRPVVLSDLYFFTSDPKQTALLFQVLDNTRTNIPRNKHFSIRACTFEGPGGKVKTTSKDDLEDVNAPGIDVIEGRERPSR